MTGLALPRARVKRKKFRPPTPLWWVAVAAYGLAIIALCIRIYDFENAPVSNACFIVYDAAMMWIWYPSIKSPYKLVVPNVVLVYRSLLLLFIGFAFGAAGL